MSKEIDADIELLKEEIRKDRMYLGPFPLNNEDSVRWRQICESNKLLAQSINVKINTFNLIVPLLNKQKFHIEFDKLCKDILENGLHSVHRKKVEDPKVQKVVVQENDDIIGVFFKALGELLSFKGNEKKKIGN